MKKVCFFLLSLAFASASFAADDATVVHWKTLKGVISAPGTSNLVAGIQSGLIPWTTTGGAVQVNLSTGDAVFTVQGLVFNGGNASGTPGAINMIKGTLVCNPGTTAQAILDGAAVPLSAGGDAHFSGNIGSVPSPCSAPVFLIRIVPVDRWIATGAVRIGGE